MAEATQTAAEAKTPSRLLFFVRSVIAQVGRHGLTDQAATMTYYMVLSIFPMLLGTISVLSLLGVADVLVPVLEQTISETINDQVSSFLTGIISSFLNSTGAGLVLVIGILTALWSASNYIGSFMRAMNRVYQVREGRPFWRFRLSQLALTLLLIVSVIVLLAAAVLSDPVIAWLGEITGWEVGVARVWSWLRWPIVGVFVVALLALLYYVAPNVRRPRFNLLSPGSLFAIIGAVVAVRVFTLYLSVFDGASSYTKTYGALAGLIIALFLMWLINLVVLIGAEVDAEIERLRELSQGLDAEAKLLLPVRDDAGLLSARRSTLALRTDAKQLKVAARADGAEPAQWYLDNAIDPQLSESEALDQTLAENGVPKNLLERILPDRSSGESE